MRLEQIGMDLTSEQQNMRQRRELLEQVLGVKAGTSCRRQVHSSIATRRWLGSSWPYRVRGLCTTEPDWQAADYVVVVEGEKAAHALTEGGIIATTPPGGAGKAGKADWTPFAKKVVGQWFTSPKVHVRNLIRAQFRNEIEIFTNTIDADAAASARNCAVIALNGFAFFQLSARLIGESPIVSGTEAAA
ncbi:MAG: hypothetical protein H0U60_04620 [Blastocatellia bacterium]|nr:hypothetical protein [Blastocatellia bacterium]